MANTNCFIIRCTLHEFAAGHIKVSPLVYRDRKHLSNPNRYSILCCHLHADIATNPYTSRLLILWHHCVQCHYHRPPSVHHYSCCYDFRNQVISYQRKIRSSPPKRINSFGLCHERGVAAMLVHCFVMWIFDCEQYMGKPSIILNCLCDSSMSNMLIQVYITNSFLRKFIYTTHLRIRKQKRCARYIKSMWMIRRQWRLGQNGLFPYSQCVRLVRSTLSTRTEDMFYSLKYWIGLTSPCGMPM